MPPLSALVPGYASHCWLTAEGEVLTLDGRQACLRLRGDHPLVCHAPAVARRLHLEGIEAYDVLTLFAFVRPARWCLPTPAGLAEAMGMRRPQNAEEAAMALLEVTQTLLNELQSKADEPKLAEHLWLAKAGGWPFADMCLHALGDTALKARQGDFSALKIWRTLPKWEDLAPPGRPGNAPITPEEAESILAAILDTPAAEQRPQQRNYSRKVASAFAPAQEEESPTLVLAEAGTGVGKTLGYLAPAFAWRRKNLGPIWLSTYTRNLQRQLDQELDKLYPNPAVKEERVVVRKGRENYLCLMNMDEAVTRTTSSVSLTQASPSDALRGYLHSGQAASAADLPDVSGGQSALPRVARNSDLMGLILMARWATASRSGELIGGDCPGWLRELAGARLSQDLAVRRGECWHGACPHYGACFAERVARKAPHAEVVVANHAFVMTQTLADPHGYGQDAKPTHFVFDEGHHLFDAADSAFGAALSGMETRDLRRWILGAERQTPTIFGGRARGLRKRLEDLADTDSDLNEALHKVERAAQILPGSGWYDRLKTGQAKGPLESFLTAIAGQVYARAKPQDSRGSYSIEVEPQPLAEGLIDVALELEDGLGKMLTPLNSLHALIQSRLEDVEDEESDEETLNDDQRRRLGGIANSIRQRAIDPVKFYLSMLADLSGETPADFIDWFEVTRVEGRDLDVGYFRKFIDPTRPFMSLLGAQTQGALITSATLTDQTGVEDVDWSQAEARVGSRHLLAAPTRVRIDSPYDYATQAKVFVVTDLERDKFGQTAGAMTRLFKASGGGALGLFTSIQRLKAAYGLMAPKLEAADLNLMAQHVDAMDVGTLVDIFREEKRACMLGTDALRDGVDVPGDSLRLVAFDRVPWPRPTLPHRARRQHFGPRTYDDMLTRLKLRQAFGRLIRTRQDRGVFVMLDSRLPSRLEGAFPDGLEVERLSLKEVLAEVKIFFSIS